MRIGKLGNKQISGTMSPNGRQMLSQRGSERSFLADQAAAAKTAMLQTLYDMKETVKRVADLRSCAREHPWLVTGSAVAVGFVTGAVLTPSPQKTGEPSRAKSEKERQPSCQEREDPRTKKSFLIATAGTLLAGVVRTVVQNSIAAAAVAKAPPRCEDQSPCDSAGTIGSEGGMA
jgi:ElaB/YqjD/DUF883 family membrane-anchored ribosome-binding protein